jgi:hypothetical protein
VGVSGGNVFQLKAVGHACNHNLICAQQFLAKIIRHGGLRWRVSPVSIRPMWDFMFTGIILLASIWSNCALDG